MEYEDRRTIATPEGVQLALPLAGVGSRCMALVLDSLIGLVALTATGVIGYVAAGEAGLGIVTASGLLLFYVGYHVLFEVSGGGRTPGKRATGLRVVSDGGAPVGLRRSLIRNFMRILEGIATWYMPAMISVVLTRHNQRLGDLLAGTLVVRDPKAVPVAGVAAGEVPADRFASWDVTGVGDPEITAVRAFLERRADLKPGARGALAAQLAARLRPQVAGARPGLSDETFLEYLAAAKARGRMRESVENGH